MNGGGIVQHSLKFVGVRGPRELPTTQTSQETHASLLPANTWKNLSSSNLSASPHLAPAQFSYSTPDLEIMAPHGRVCQLRAPSTTSPGSHPLWPWRLSTLTYSPKLQSTQELVFPGRQARLFLSAPPTPAARRCLPIFIFADRDRFRARKSTGSVRPAPPRRGS